MKFPLSTGEVARILGTTEPKLSEEVRRGRVVPAPRVFAGRRIWEQTHVYQVGVRLGLLTPSLCQQLGSTPTGACLDRQDTEGEA